MELAHALDMLESVVRHSRAVSKEFVKLFTDDVIKPYAEAERWDELAESIQASRPLAAQALLAVFRRTMDEAVETTFTDLAMAPSARRMMSKRRGRSQMGSWRSAWLGVERPCRWSRS